MPLCLQGALIDMRMERLRWDFDVSRITCPVEFRVGSVDKCVGTAPTQHSHEVLVPNSNFHIVEGRSHLDIMNAQPLGELLAVMLHESTSAAQSVPAVGSRRIGCF